MGGEGGRRRKGRSGIPNDVGYGDDENSCSIMEGLREAGHEGEEGKGRCSVCVGRHEEE